MCRESPYKYSHQTFARLYVWFYLMYIAEGYKCKQEVSCLHVSRAVGTMCEVVSSHCFSPSCQPLPPLSLMLLVWDGGQ